MKLLAVLLVALLLSGCLAKVGNFNQDCPQFFSKLNEVISPPTMFVGPQYRQICQTLNNQVEFATFYDTNNKIPVFSAYKFSGRVTCVRLNKWFIEPQLDDQNQDGNMNKEIVGKYGTNQARNDDYDNQKTYHKGHLAPVYHSSTQSCADATFTLTNAAPQEASFNRHWFHEAEKKWAEQATENCINKRLSVYVVTGVVPGNNKLNNRVLIPSHFWTAFCCLDNNNKPKFSTGYYGENQAQHTIQEVNLRNLEIILQKLYGTAFTVFHGVC